MAVNDFYINVNVVPCELKTPAMTTIYGVHVPAELIHGTRLAGSPDSRVERDMTMKVQKPEKRVERTVE